MDLAQKSRMSFSHWIYETVESHLAREGKDFQEVSTQRVSLQAENRQLRRDLQAREARISDLETEVFKLRNQLFASEKPVGLGEMDGRLLDALRSGGLWSNREILAELGVDANDADAIQIVTVQLRFLQDHGLVKESARGWRWIG